MTGIRLTRAQVYKVQSLLDMMYKPVEIAEEMGVTVETVYRSYLPAGAPSVVDKSERIWIHGKSFAKWAKAYLEVKEGKPHLVMEDSQAYCVTCNEVVTMQTPRKRDVKKGVARLVGHCPKCGKVVNRFMRGLLSAGNAALS